MTEEQIVAVMINALELRGVPYMLGGSFVTNFYGVLNAKNDVSFVVDSGPIALAAVLTGVGSEFDVGQRVTSHGIPSGQRFTLRVPGSGITVQFFPRTVDDHDQVSFKRRKHVKMIGRDVPIPSVEDVIISRLRWAQAMQFGSGIDEIANLIAVHWNRLDAGYVERWCLTHGTKPVFEMARSMLRSVMFASGGQHLC